MKKTLISLFLFGLIVTFFPLSAKSGVDFGISFDENGVKDFHVAISKHYNVPEKEILVVQKKRIPDEELPVLFFLAKHLDVSNSVILKLRLSGKSWVDICHYYTLSPDIFFVELKKNPGPPYGKAYGHFKNKPRKNWREISLSNDDIINFVNLKFISDHYGYDPDFVAEMRGKGRGFVEINQTVKQKKNDKSKQAKAEYKKSKKSSKSKSKKK